MEVAVDDELRTVTVRHPTRALVLRGGALLVLGVALPAWVEATVPGLVVPALLATAAAAFWVVQGLVAVLVLDEDGVVLSASRRARRHVPWDDVAALTADDLRATVRTTDGRTLHGPPADDALVGRARDAAWELGILPDRLR